jgi:hypothetical protein
MGKIFNLALTVPEFTIGTSKQQHINSPDEGVSVEQFPRKARYFDGMRIQKLEIFLKADITSQADVDDLIEGLQILKRTFK